MSDYSMSVSNIPEGHVVVGHVSHLKILDENGELYFAERSSGLNDMEKYGLAVSMADSMSQDLLSWRKEVE